MSRNDRAALLTDDLAEHPLHHLGDTRETTRARTLVIRQGSAWQSLALLLLCLLILAVVLLGHQALQAVERQQRVTAEAMSRFERKIEQVESGISFESKRRQLVLGMRDHIMRVNPRASLGDAYRYAQLAVQAGEKYPSVDPLLLLSIGTVESRYDPLAVSKADARGLYQIWPSSGRLLFRALGWDYDDAALHDPEKNTEAAALYLDILFTAYGDPQMVLAEYNGGPLNAGYFRAGVSALAAETRNYVPQVLELYERLKDRFAKGADAQLETMHRDGQREGKALAGALSAGTLATRNARRPAEPSPPPVERAPAKR